MLSNLVGNLLASVQGYKTMIAASGLAIVTLMEFLAGSLFTGIYSGLLALAIFGIGNKIDRLQAAFDAQKSQQ